MPPPRESREDKKRANRLPPRLAAEQKPRLAAAPESPAQKAPLEPPLQFQLNLTAEQKPMMPTTTACTAPLKFPRQLAAE
jgi:hypothetical protein